MKPIKYCCCISVCMLALLAGADIADNDYCSIRNNTTQNGEEISYTVYYSVAGAYVVAGSATFTNKLEKLNNQMVYHVTGSGKSNSKYDWIYKVRDRYESYIDTATMLPLKFVRNVHEGSTKKYESISFNRTANTVITGKGVSRVPPCVQDALSTIYYARNIDFSKYKVNDKIPFQMFIEDELHDVYIRYLGKEQVKTKHGKFSAIKFKALLIKGTVFKGGEDMIVWVGDDPNRIPVRIEAPILIGSIKVDMTGYNNLRYPLLSLRKK